MVQVQDLSFQYEDAPLLQGVSFDVEPQEFWHIKGKNGCGKSTLLKLFSGLLKTDSGTVTTPDKIFFLDHKLGLKDHWTVEKTLRFYEALYQAPTPSNLFGLEAVQEASILSLSLGQKKRLQLLQLFYIDTKLWILDEPTHGLDQEGLNFLIQTLQSHIKNGGSVLCAHHGGALDQIKGPTLSLSDTEGSDERTLAA